MRWFKHRTDADGNEKLARLQDAFGLEGYGFWWRVVEIIATRVTEENRTDLCYSAKNWARRIGVSTRKFKKLLSFCAELGLVYVSHEKDMVTINMPNILKYRDEYTAKKGRTKSVSDDVSGQCPDSRARALTETETDTETDIKRKQTKEKVAPAKTETPPGPLSGGDGCFADGEKLSSSGKKTERKKKATGNSIPELQAMIDAYTSSAKLREALNAYRVMRERIRKPLTGDGLRYTFRELDKLCGDDDAQKIAATEQSVQRSWQGIFPVKDNSAWTSSNNEEADPTNGHGPRFFSDDTMNPWGTFWESMLYDGHSTPEYVAEKGYNLDEARKIYESGKRDKSRARSASSNGSATADLARNGKNDSGRPAAGLDTATAFGVGRMPAQPGRGDYAAVVNMAGNASGNVRQHV